MIRIFHKNARDKELSELKQPAKGSWICVTKPGSKDLSDLSMLLDLDKATLTDALDPYEAPRIAVDETDVYIFTRYCHPQNETSSTEPILILHTPTQVLTVSPFATDFLTDIPQRIAPTTTQKTKLVILLLGQINETYRVYLDEITRTVFKIRSQLSRDTISNAEFLKLIDIEEDLNEMLTSLQPHGLVLDGLFSGKYLHLHEEDQELVEDLKLSTSELIELTRSRLRTMENIREVYTTISANNLNATFKRLASISIFIAIPTVVGGLYGMNVLLPFGNSQYAFWFIMASVTVVLMIVISIFKRNRWL